MRNLLALAALALLAFAVVGWYLGWYRLQTEPTGDGHRQVTIDIDGKKVGQDLKRGEEKLHDLVENKGTTPAQPAAPGTAPGAQVPELPIPPPPPPPGTVNTAQGQPGWSHPDEKYAIPDVVIPPPPPAQ